MSRKSGSWVINAMRDPERSARHAVLAAQSAVRLPRRHAPDRADRSPRRHDRPGHRPLPPVGDGGSGSARRKRVPGAPATGAREAGSRPDREAGRGSGGLLPLDGAFTQARARRARCRAEGPRRPPDSLDARHEGAGRRSSGRRTNCASAAASRPGRAASTRAPRRPSTRCATTMPVNRLGLARWLVDENNPLVARVAVNRLWEQIFGRGLVETSEDFGAQGAPPTHPELLDWLATEFIDQQVEPEVHHPHHRALVPPTANRRPSRPALEERDPYNRLLARGPRVPHGSRDGARRVARRERPAQRENVRPKRLPAAAARHLEHALQQR